MILQLIYHSNTTLQRAGCRRQAIGKGPGAARDASIARFVLSLNAGAPFKPENMPPPLSRRHALAADFHHPNTTPQRAGCRRQATGGGPGAARDASIARFVLSLNAGPPHKAKNAALI